MIIFKPLLVLAFALAAAPALAADTPITQSHKLASGATLNVDNISGAVVVHTWDKDQVRMAGSLGYNSRLDVSGDAHELSIAVKKKDDSHSSWFGGDSMGSSTLELTVPRGVNLRVHTVSARIQADGLDGGKIVAKSVSGTIAIAAHSPTLEVESTSGDVAVTGSADSVDVTTVSGDIRIERVASKASTQSVSGDIRLAGGPFEHVAMESVSGDLYLHGTMAPEVSANLHSMSGDIHMTLANAPQATLDASSFSGDIRSAWGQVVQPKYGPGSSLHARIGSAKGSILLKSFSGDVDISQGG